MKQKTIFVEGVFDLFHEGHINFLKQASSHGRLIVGVMSDFYAERYKRKPVIPEATRYAVVRACRYVDEVVEGTDKLTAEIIDEHKIDLVFHGDDFNEEQVIEHYQAALDRGIFRYLPYTKEVSSSKIINEIEKRFQK